MRGKYAFPFNRSEIAKYDFPMTEVNETSVSSCVFNKAEELKELYQLLEKN